MFMLCILFVFGFFVYIFCFLVGDEDFCGRWMGVADSGRIPRQFASTFSEAESCFGDFCF